MRATRALGTVLLRGADATARAFEGAINASAEVVADLLETIGNGLVDVVSNATRSHRLVRWLVGVPAAGLELVASMVKSAAAIGAGGLAGATRILGGGIGGSLALDSALLEQGARDILAGCAGAVIVLAGDVVALVQTALALQAAKRPLRDDERNMLKSVFGRSVALFNVRVVEGRAGIFGINRRPFTLGNTIYTKAIDTTSRPSVLVHECVHAWQYQHRGARYAAEALGAQALLADAYDWRTPVERGASSWERLNAEAQAQLLGDLYSSGLDQPFVVDGRDHTAFAGAALELVRRRRSPRPSRGLDPAEEGSPPRRIIEG